MTPCFAVDIDGQRLSVLLDTRAWPQVTATVDGRVYQVDAAPAGATLSLIAGVGILESHSVTIVDAPAAAGELTLRMQDGTTFRAVVESTVRRRRQRTGERDRDGEQKVSAPMPGRVVRVLVAEGDEVAVGQAVIVVEAMKMENELRSPKAGRVKTVNAESGLSVEAGRVLLLIE
jgi:biotin carboxyl carrier protein